MAQWVEALATKPNDLSSIPKTRVAEREHQYPGRRVNRAVQFSANLSSRLLCLLKFPQSFQTVHQVRAKP